MNFTKPRLVTVFLIFGVILALICAQAYRRFRHHGYQQTCTANIDFIWGIKEEYERKYKPVLGTQVTWDQLKLVQPDLDPKTLLCPLGFEYDPGLVGAPPRCLSNRVGHPFVIADPESEYFAYHNWSHEWSDFGESPYEEAVRTLAEK